MEILKSLDPVKRTVKKMDGWVDGNYLCEAIRSCYYEEICQFTYG